jgi:hypothetical protein
MDDEILERNKNLNQGFRKLRVWREDIRGQRSKIMGVLWGWMIAFGRDGFLWDGWLRWMNRMIRFANGMNSLLNWDDKQDRLAHG